MNNYLKTFALSAMLIIAHWCSAQTNLIGKAITERKICVGDTIFIRFNEEVQITPLRTSEFKIYKNTPDDLNSYIGGYLSKTPVYSNEKRKKNPVYAYKGTYQSNYTSSSTIANNNMIVLEIKEKELGSKMPGRCNDFTLLNSSNGDTIILRKPFIDKIHLFDSICIENVSRELQNQFVGKKFFGCVYNNDTIQYNRKMTGAYQAFNGWRFNTNYYREYTITDCRCITTWLEYSSFIIINYKDSFGNMYEYTHYPNSAYNKGVIWHTEKELDSIQDHTLFLMDSIQKAEQQKQLMSGSYHFELTKVEKPKSQNVKKGKLTDNNVYEDNLISIQWHEDRMQFYFNLKNMTSNTMKLIWDDALIVNFDGFTERVLHKGADIEALQKPQQPAIIPSLAQLADYYCSECYYGGKRLLSGYGGNNNNGINDGKEMRLFVPVQVGTTTYTYSFTFTLKWKYSHPELRE